MCPPTDDQAQQHPRKDASKSKPADDFPWHIGVYDAHCHYTDIISSVENIDKMKARCVTIMATRAQDQDLVASVATQHGVRSQDDLGTRKVVPSFGWHPWFSYQFYNDAAADDVTYDANDTDKQQQKARHYTAVLSPTPDADFIASLPDPRPLRGYIAETRNRLIAFPTALVGEIGLDKPFRLPAAWSTSELDRATEKHEGATPGGREGRKLSPYHVRMPHQQEVLKAQLRLAGELGRAVSVHGVQAHGVLFDVFTSLWKGHEKEVISKRQQRRVAEGAEDFSEDEDEGDKNSAPKPFPPRVCLHSFSGAPQMLSQYLAPSIPAMVYFSFSVGVNLATGRGENKIDDVIRACPDDRLLVESDLHHAGDDADADLEEMHRKVCEVKGWSLVDGVEKIRKNYEEFIFG